MQSVKDYQVQELPVPSKDGTELIQVIALLNPFSAEKTQFETDKKSIKEIIEKTEKSIGIHDSSPLYSVIATIIMNIIDATVPDVKKNFGKQTVFPFVFLIKRKSPIIISTISNDAIIKIYFIASLPMLTFDHCIIFPPELQEKAPLTAELLIYRFIPTRSL